MKAKSNCSRLDKDWLIGIHNRQQNVQRPLEISEPSSGAANGWVVLGKQQYVQGSAMLASLISSCIGPMLIGFNLLHLSHPYVLRSSTQTYQSSFGAFIISWFDKQTLGDALHDLEL
jgi:hypothetical protein